MAFKKLANGNIGKFILNIGNITISLTEKTYEKIDNTLEYLRKNNKKTFKILSVLLAIATIPTIGNISVMIVEWILNYLEFYNISNISFGASSKINKMLEFALASMIDVAILLRILHNSKRVKKDENMELAYQEMMLTI
jgi:hypothetical protein